MVEIGEIDFRDLKLKVYYDSSIKDELIVWSARNSDKLYDGFVYINDATGEIHENVSLPVETETDREIIPKYIIIPYKLSNKIIDKLKESLELEYNKRNIVR